MMKTLVRICLLSLVTMALAEVTDEMAEMKHEIIHSRGCIYVEGHCQEECPEGTHGYGSGCGRKLPEATCDQPKPEPEGGSLCDYTACYCDAPTVRDTKTNKCVPLDECPKKE